MFVHRESLEATSTTSRVDVAFTDSSLDLQELGPDLPGELARLETAVGVPVARLHQVHGDAVHVLTQVAPRGPLEVDDLPHADAQVSALAGVALMVRVADCVPVLLADPDAGVIGAVHAGRKGVALDVVTRAVERMRGLGATTITAWIGPHVCGACYEVPAEMRGEVGALVPDTVATTSWGTPSLDLGAGVHAQLERAGVTAVAVAGCTREDPRLHSHRRDGAGSGRFAGLVWLTRDDVMATSGPHREIP